MKNTGLFHLIMVCHKNSKTTEIYTHISNKTQGKIISPLDTLDFKETKR